MFWGVFGVDRHTYTKPKVKRMIVVGLDGFDPGLAKRFSEEGLMPNFKALEEQGCFGIQFDPDAIPAPVRQFLLERDMATAIRLINELGLEGVGHLDVLIVELTGFLAHRSRRGGLLRQHERTQGGSENHHEYTTSRL